MWGYLGMMTAGLICGALMGFCLGREFAPDCVERMTGKFEEYRGAYRDGWHQCAAVFGGQIRQRSVEAKNTWTITKGELDRLEEEMTEYDSD